MEYNSTQEASISDYHHKCALCFVNYTSMPSVRIIIIINCKKNNKKYYFVIVMLLFFKFNIIEDETNKRGEIS